MAVALQREMNRLFEDFLCPEGGERCLERCLARGTQQGGPADVFWVPRIDVREDDKQIIVQVELPGIPKDKINIETINNVLCIFGETEERREVNKRGLRVQERRSGRFERRIGLPSSVDYNKVDAKLENGVLNIALPKTAEAQGRRIAVK